MHYLLCPYFIALWIWEGIVKHKHVIVQPLHFVNNVQASMHNERIQTPCLSRKSCYAIPTLLGSSKFEFEQWIVFGPNDAEVV